MRSNENSAAIDSELKETTRRPNFIFYGTFFISLIKIVHFCLFINNYSLILKHKFWIGWVESNLNMRINESAPVWLWGIPHSACGGLNLILFWTILCSLIKIVDFCLFKNKFSLILKQKIWGRWVESNLIYRRNRPAAAYKWIKGSAAYAVGSRHNLIFLWNCILYGLIKIVHFCLFRNNYSLILKPKNWGRWVEKN
jgi:hypothetical protein